MTRSCGHGGRHARAFRRCAVLPDRARMNLGAFARIREDRDKLENFMHGAEYA